MIDPGAGNAQPFDLGAQDADSGSLLGRLLVTRGLLSEQQLDFALAEQREKGGLIGQILVENRFIDGTQLADVLAVQFDMMRFDVGMEPPSPEALLHLPADFCREVGVVPLRAEEQDLLVGICDPTDAGAQQRVVAMLADHRVSWAVITPGDLVGALRVYDADATIGESGLPDSAAPARAQQTVIADTEDIRRQVSLKPAVRLVNELIEVALREGASDIHAEPEFDHSLVRLRIDGELRPLLRMTMPAHNMLIGRSKLLAGLDLARRAEPQDGHFSAVAGQEQVAVRVSVLPVVGGESLVLRLTAEGGQLPSFSSLGLSDEVAHTLRTVLDRPQGLLMLTGPTGAGKSQTMYAALGRLLRRSLNIVTIEDPVERNVPGFKQIQIDERSGIGFADAFRSVLRHDPDVIMIAEVRDLETARIATQAATNGHLVLTTMHTNDAIAAIPRLRSMGLETYMIATGLTAVYAQRLYRPSCTACGEMRPIEPRLRDMLKNLLGRDDVPAEEFHGVGCPQCAFTGYGDRRAVGEVLVLDENAQRLIYEDADADSIRDYAVGTGMVSLREAAAHKLADGVTTAVEVMRVGTAS